MSHEEPGATDHSSVEWDVVFDRILSILGLSPRVYVLFSHSFYLILYDDLVPGAGADALPEYDCDD